MRIAVLGAGIAGLAAAHHLRRRAEVVVFEASDRIGGNIRTEAIEGCLVEWGPNGFLDNEPATLELVEELGLNSRLQQARSSAAIRYVWRQGRLRELPTSPPKFLLSDCLPLGARLRAMLEPFSRKPPGTDESVRDFAARHLGRGAADILVDAMVTGIFAGDPNRLSLRSAFPKLFALEAEHGSLIKGAKGRGVGPKGTLTSFDGGLQVLVDTLAKDLDIRLGVDLDALPDGFDHIVSTIPAPRAVQVLPAELKPLLQRIPMAPVVVVALIYKSEITVPDAFGFLVPRGQGLRILGTLYDSSIFAGRAPEGGRLFRTLIGGRRDPEAVHLSDEELLEIAARDLARAWGAFPEPDAYRVIRHRLGIAQYEIGHQQLLQELDHACPSHLRLAGSSYRGVALNACVKEAREWAP
ncbi:MAG: protoporphyrinogen oxidase [Acidobacteriota bacterium]